VSRAAKETTPMKNDVTGTDRRPEKYQLLPELPPEQFQALKADIAERGVIVAVLVDEFGAILDGHNRARACRELGINDDPVEVRSGLTEAEKRALARNLNALRRHLTREQVRSLIADQLQDTPEWSNRRVAGGLGVDDKTVASVRMGLMATAEFPQLDKTVGADGKARRAPPKRRRKSHSAPLADDELFLDDEGDDTDEAVAADPKQDKARRREEREQRRADKEWEAIGATAGEVRARRRPRKDGGRSQFGKGRQAAARGPLGHIRKSRLQHVRQLYRGGKTRVARVPAVSGEA
jgi:ParB-like chromosome segregation protein Spo0J